MCSSQINDDGDDDDDDCVHTRGTQNISELSPTFTAHSKRVHEFDAFSSKC